MIPFKHLLPFAIFAVVAAVPSDLVDLWIYGPSHDNPARGDSLHVYEKRSKYNIESSYVYKREVDVTQLGGEKRDVTGKNKEKTPTQSAAPPVSKQCNNDGSVCAAINIPESGSSTFFQIKTSKSNGWSGVGVGSGMAGALMFILYPSKDGKNVTVSPRIGIGHVQPDREAGRSIKLEMLEGTGVNGDEMTANFKCRNCRSWGAGAIDLTSTSQYFIWAVGGQPGSIMSDQLDATIQKHYNNGYFSLDTKNARGGNGKINPFAENVRIVVVPNGGSSISKPVSRVDRILIAHGAIMALVWVLLFPLGAAFIRLLNNFLPNPLLLHRGLQAINVLLAIVGMALGMVASGINKTHFKYFHQYLGVILIGSLFVQGALGQLHHNEYLKTGKRSQWSYAHIWVGRTVIVLGIINGGIGLSLIGASTGQKVVYSIIALLVGLVYTLFYLLNQRKLRLGH